MTKKDLLKLLEGFDNDLEIVVESLDWFTLGGGERVGLYPIGISSELLEEDKILIRTSEMEIFTFKERRI